MSKLQDLLKETDTLFILPVLSALRYSTMVNKDKALCVVFREGYIESKSLDAIVALRLYFKHAEEQGFYPKGRIDLIKLNDGSTTYRQRLYFSSINKLLLVLKQYSISLNILDSFKLSDRHKRFLGKELTNLQSLCPVSDVATWIRNSTFIQLAFLCNIVGVSFRMPIGLEEICSDGILNKSLYICGSVSADSASSTLMIIPLDYFKEKGLMYLLGTKGGYYLDYKGKLMLIKGYTRRNLKFYRRRSLNNGYRRKHTVRH